MFICCSDFVVISLLDLFSPSIYLPLNLAQYKGRGKGKNHSPFNIHGFMKYADNEYGVFFYGINDYMALVGANTNGRV